MTVCINLIPPDILFTRRVHARRRRWITASFMLALIGVAASIIVRTSLRDPRGLAGELEYERERLGLLTSKVEAARASLRASQQKLAAVGGLADRPNWKILMSLLAQARSDATVIDAVALKKAPPAPPPATAPPGTAPQDDGAFLAIVRGRGDNQLDITTFALSLEKTRLFESVRQDSVKAVRVGERDLLEFQFICRIAPRPEAKEGGK